MRLSLDMLVYNNSDVSEFFLNDLFIDMTSEG